jgi:hypothetical protein
MMNPLFLACALALFMFSCSEWEQPVPIPDSGGIKSERVILIEEFTGASCTNCPAGSAELKAILDKYPDNVVVVGLHSKFLSAPADPADPNLFTDDAENIEIFLGRGAKPEAAFNRNLFPENRNIRISRPDTWNTFVDRELKASHQADLRISVDFDSSSRKMSMTLTAIARQDINEPVHAHAVVTESGISITQLSLTGKIPNYIQQHVLRKALTPVGGVKIADSMKTGESVSKSFEFVLPPQDNKLWIAKNCAAVGFISLGESKKYVLQAAEAKLVK